MRSIAHACLRNFWFAGLKLRAAKMTSSTTFAMLALALAFGTHAFAQEASTKPPPAPAQVAPGNKTVEKDPRQLQLISSSWKRYCARGLTEQSSKVGTKEVCFTASDGHVASGQKFIIALLIERENNDTKMLRVTLPLGVALVPGVRVVVDEERAMTAPYVVCLSKNGCMADFKADADFIEKLKKGRTLAIQAFDKGKPISFTLPLAGFAKAYAGPASDPTGLNGLGEGLQNEPQNELQNPGDHLVAPRGK